MSRRSDGNIWLMDADGRNAVAITSGPTAHDSAPPWSPDGRTILRERVDTTQLGAEPTVWTFNVGTGAALGLAGDEYRAAWLP